MISTGEHVGRRETDLQRWILAIADDLTGALETGARFAEYGFPATVTTCHAFQSEPSAGVHVVDTESRHLPGQEAAAIVRALGEAARRYDPWLIYKKTDSTLRGNIAAEVRALHEVWPERGIDYQAAYPALGRIVRKGKLLVHGVEVHRTAFAFDALNPVRTCDIRVLLRDVPVTVRDGESDVDMDASAVALFRAEPLPIAAGPAAFAGALARHLRPCGRMARPMPCLPHCLVINGSRHPASVAQIEYAREQGMFGGGWCYFDEAVEGDGLEWARQAGAAVRRRLESAPVKGLVVFGGDTAYGIHQALGAAPFEPWGEIVPGVPLSRCGGLYWITKAGGFGEPDILGEIGKRVS